MSLEGLKAGDFVFVVRQIGRGRQEKKSNELVSRVGRKYGFIEVYNREARFLLENGHSCSQDGNDRANGYGFDVYRSEADYVQSMNNDEELERLKGRILMRHGSLFILFLSSQIDSEKQKKYLSDRINSLSVEVAIYRKAMREAQKHVDDSQVSK